MLSKLFKKKKLEVVAPIHGKIVSLEEVPDAVFSKKMMGDGIAIIPKDGKVYAPIDGEVLLVADTKHAVGLKANDGTELLIHIGLETVMLKGEGFTTLVKAGDEVKVGEPLLEVNWGYIGEHASSTITPIIVTNSDERIIELTIAQESIAGETILFTASPK